MKLISSGRCPRCDDCHKEQDNRCLVTLRNINGRRFSVHLQHGGLGKVHGGLVIIPKDKTDMHQVLSERCDLCCLQYLE